jgi:hypothetical protein
LLLLLPPPETAMSYTVPAANRDSRKGGSQHDNGALSNPQPGASEV